MRQEAVPKGLDSLDSEYAEYNISENCMSNIFTDEEHDKFFADLDFQYEIPRLHEIQGNRGSLILIIIGRGYSPDILP